MARLDISFQEEFAKIQAGDTVLIWNDIDIDNAIFVSLTTSNVTINGQGHTLRGLTKPLFTGTITGATVSNLSICCEIRETGNDWGAFFRRATNAKIINCHARGKVLCPSSENVGGIAGYIGGTTSVIDGCTSRCEISGNNYLGGIAGYASGTKIIKCVNEGKIKCMFMHAGGIAGLITNRSVIENCVNARSGTVSPATPGATSNHVAGITGHITSSSVQCSVNNATINGQEGVAGIVGYLDGTATPYPSNTVRDNKNTGVITGTNYVGGIVAQLQESGRTLIADNQSICGIVGTNYVGGILGGSGITNGNLSTEIKNNQVSSGSIGGTGTVHRIVGRFQPGMYLVYNLADKAVKVRGDNRTVGGLMYAGAELVRDTDPMVGSHLQHGLTCDLCKLNACVPPPKLCCR